MDLFRSLLFVPGNQERMLTKAATFNPDVFIPDMEDSVASDNKTEARSIVSNHIQLLAAGERLVIPRLNALDTGLLEEDLDSVIKTEVFGISVGKIQNVDDVDHIDQLMGEAELKANLKKGTLRLLPWIETAAGVLNAYGILSRSTRICAAAFGAEDYTNDMGIERRGDNDEITYAKNHVAIAARAAGVPALDTPFFAFRDLDALRRDADDSRAIGYKGKFAIHPNQINIINECFSPSKEEIKHATDVIKAFEEASARGRGSTSLDGSVVDVPVVKRAQGLLAAASRMGIIGK